MKQVTLEVQDQENPCEYAIEVHLCIKLGSNEDFKDLLTILNFCLRKILILEAEKDNIKRDEFRVESLFGKTLLYSNEVCQEPGVNQLTWRRGMPGSLIEEMDLEKCGKS